ncbi:MAG TPA: metallophosphoesterase [Thermoanaerobaculia bacterium]|nr:metallophosphoesterase [Thermoanaerobaculia bacterium]
MRGVYCSALAAVLALAAHAATLPEIQVHPNNGVLRFAVAGDIGRETRTIASAIETVQRAEPLDFIVVPGDNVYPCGVKSLVDPRWSILHPLLRIGLPVFPVLGNHDVCGNAAAQIGAPLPNWNFPARQYAIRGEVADLAMVDTTDYASGKSRDAENAIAEVFGPSTAAWRIVVGHHTIFSSGWHGHYPRREARRMLKLVAPLRASAVDLYICGHDHHEELVDSTPLMLVSGAGSDPVPVLRLRSDTVFPPRRSLVEHIGFAVVEVTAQRLRIRFYDSRGRPRSEWFTYGP